MLARHRRHHVIAACHSASLAEHFGRRVRALAATHPDTLGYTLSPERRAAGDWLTSGGGAYFAAGLRGPITGRRADLVVIDDPIRSHAEADSAMHRDHVWDWYRTDLVTRLKPHGRIALVMTRWHQDDLGGRLLDSGEHWTVLRLPALAEANDPLGRAAGAALWPDYEDAAMLANKRAVVGPRVWQAQYQQSPTPDTGALFSITRVATDETPPDGLRCVRAWDLAASEAGTGRDPDYTVGLKLGREPSGRLWVLDIVRVRAGPAGVEEAILNTARQDGHAIPVGLPQDPGQAGKQQVAWLTGRLAGFRVHSSPETGAKITRAMPVAANVDAGLMTLARAAWNRPFLDELRDFPHGRHDDQIDALARAHAMLMDAPQPMRRMHLPLIGR